MKIKHGNAKLNAKYGKKSIYSKSTTKFHLFLRSISSVISKIHSHVFLSERIAIV